MTTSTWDKTDIARDFQGCQTLQDMIAGLETRFTTKGEVICEIRVNGQRVDEEDASVLASYVPAALETLVVYSSAPSVLITQALQSSFEYIPHVQRLCLAASEQMRGTNIVDGREAFAEAIEGCFWLVDTLKHVRGAASGSGFDLNQPQKWIQAEHRFASTVKDVVSAFELKDSVLVADLMEYEVSEVVTIWGDVLREQLAS